MSHYNVTSGRFNIPHLGHRKLFQIVASMPGEHIIGVTSSQKTNAPLSLRMTALESLGDFNYAPISNLFSLVHGLVKEGHTVTVVLGSDQEGMAKALQAKYPWSVTTRILSREDGYSSTSVRRMLADRRFDEAQKATGNVPLTTSVLLHKFSAK